MANDSGLFRTREQLEDDGWYSEGNVFLRGEQTYLPLYEAKMVHYFDHCFGTYEGQTDSQANQSKLPELGESEHAEPYRVTLPWYWVPADKVDDRLEGKSQREWLLGWRDVCRNTDTRTLIASFIPRAAVGDKFLLMFPALLEHRFAPCLLANLNSFVLDYCARQKIGGTALKYFIMRQLPVLSPSTYEGESAWYQGKAVDWFFPRVLELTYTAWDLARFARDCGYDGPPFRWDGARRFLLRCELDAAFFHLYGIDRNDAAYILDTFPVVRKKDEAAHGEYRTKRIILEIYDRMANAMRTGIAYENLLHPSPGPPAEALPEWLPGEANPPGWPAHIHPPRRVEQPEAVSRRQVTHDLHTLEVARVASYVVLLLREWKKPATRNSLEVGLVLMLNDQARAQIAARPVAVAKKSSSNALPQFVQGLDGLLDQLQTTGFIRVQTTKHRQVIRLGPNAPDTAAAPAEDIARVRETLDAFRIVGEDRASVIVPLLVTERYELVS